MTEMKILSEPPPEENPDKFKIFPKKDNTTNPPYAAPITVSSSGGNKKE